MPLPRAVLYDWDNTLVDTWPVIHAATNGLFRYMGMPEWTLEETRARVRKSLRDTFPEIFGDRWEEARDVFYEQFEALHLQELTAAQNAKELLGFISSDLGIPQAVVSNKQGKYLRTEVSHLGWDGHFRHLVGAGDADRDKPAPDPVHLVLGSLEISPAPDILFVGDSNVDMEIAHVTGLTPVLIHSDPDMEGEFKDHPPALHFRDLKAFHDFLTAKQ